MNDCGIIYGDLHYGNMMIRDDGKLVLIDFGWGFTLDYTGQPLYPEDYATKQIPKNLLGNKTIPYLDINTIKLGQVLEKFYN